MSVIRNFVFCRVGELMTLEEGPESKKPSEEEVRQNEEGEKNASIIAHVNNFFGWLGDLITEQARIDALVEPSPPPIQTAHHVSRVLQKTSEVIANAEKICNNLEDVKTRLSLEFGVTAATFISKCIDPMIDHARQLIKALHSSDHTNGSKVIDQAIESVELYAQFSDEKKLYRKIVQNAQSVIKQSIDKDIEILANYKQQALDASDSAEQEKAECEFQLDRFLYPIVSELLGMAESNLITDDLHAFFVWKSNVDERRNSLVELGLLTIDSLRGSSRTPDIITDEEGEEIPIDEPLSDIFKQQLEESSLAMSFLSSLEDRVNQVFTRLELIEFEDEQSLDEITALLEYLKVDTDRLAKLSSHTKHVVDNFKALKESILSAEALVNRRKRI